MEKFIAQTESYTIWKISTENLFELAEFVVRENYKHHVGHYTDEEIRHEIELVYQEELLYADTSIAFLVRNLEGRTIGSIRIFKWDRHQILPIQKLFGINPLTSIHAGEEYSYWHIGRFAIDSFAGISTLTLFKQLMVYAIHPIIQTEQSYMVAETDSKLLKVMNALGIQTTQLGESLNYLASETIPVCSSREGLIPFYNRYKGLRAVS
ncbi:MAG: hypothetical protein IKU98_06830 [Bacteroidaceae bacterium]|nr:hypothetical protein [Bacteroidaceae bacterium]